MRYLIGYVVALIVATTGLVACDKGSDPPQAACRVLVNTPTIEEDDFVLPPGCDFIRLNHP